MLWGLRPIEQQAAYGLIVARIRRQIHLGLMLPGERLPAERKLAEEMGVSRVTLREALRVLETEGYISSIRRGAYGGSFIADEKTLDQIANMRAARDPGGFLRALEFREATEVGAARFAALRRTPADVKRLRVGLDAMLKVDSRGELRRAESTFHLALGEASHNSLLANALEEALAESFAPLGGGNTRQLPAARHALRAELFQAIEARDPVAAGGLISAILNEERSRLKRGARIA